MGDHFDTDRLVRWQRASLTRSVVPLAAVAVACARCGGMVAMRHAERDPYTGAWAHRGNCPWRSLARQGAQDRAA
jgi:hypothetical protein